MKKYIIKQFMMSNDMPMLREVDIETGRKRMMNLPLKNDEDLKIQSYKYPNETLAEIREKDLEYLYWIIKESKYSDSIKKSVARVIWQEPYVVPKEDTIITEYELYNPERAVWIINKIKNQ